MTQEEGGCHNLGGDTRGRTGERERAPSHLATHSALQVNFLIFIRVICIVVSKLKANLMCKTDIKCRYSSRLGFIGSPELGLLAEAEIPQCLVWSHPDPLLSPSSD